MVPAKMGSLAFQMAALLATASSALAGTSAEAAPAKVTPTAAPAQADRWFIPDGTKLSVVIQSEAGASDDRVAARVEHAPAALGLPASSIIEGRLVVVDPAGEYHPGSLTVLFDRISPGGRGPSQAMEPFVLRFQYGRGVARLNKILLIGAPAAAAGLGALAAGGTGAYSFAPGGLSYALGFARHPREPKLKVGDRRKAEVRRIDLGFHTAAMRRTGWPLRTLPDLRTRAEREPAACALYLELRGEDPHLLAQVAEHYARSGEMRVAREVLDEAIDICGRPTAFQKYDQSAENLKAYALAAIAAVEARLGRVSKARKIAQTIESDSGHLMGGPAKDVAQAAIATQLARTGDFDAALELVNDRWGCRWLRVPERPAQCVADEAARMRTLAEIAILLTGAGKDERALRTIEAITDPYEKGRALEALCVGLATRGQRVRALRVLADASTQADDAVLLTRLAAAYRRLDAGADGEPLLERAVRLTDRTADNPDAAAERMLVARECAEYGRQPQAADMLEHTFKVVRAAEYEVLSRQLALLRDAAALSARAGRFERAQEMADAIGDEYYGGEALAEIVRAYVDVGKMPQALGLARTIRDADHRARALCSVAGGLAAAGRKAEAAAALTTALAAVPQSLNPAPHLLEIDAQYHATGLTPDAEARRTLREMLVETKP